MGEWLVDPSDNSLSNSRGQLVRLEPKVMEVLAILIQNRGHVVAKEDLLNKVWPNTFVAEVALSRCVSQLRSAMGDDTRSPRFIETIPKRGYRLVAPVSEPRAAVPRYRRFPMSVGIIAGLALLFLAVLVYWLAEKRDGHEQGSPPMHLTSYHGEEYDASFSPNGDEVVFNWNGEGGDNWDIYVKQVRGTGEMRLTTDPALDHSPVWSPDGTGIAFARSRPPGLTEIILVPSRGGAERVVAKVDSQGLGRLLSWTPDGKGLAVRARTSPTASYAICMLSVESGKLRQLTEPDEGNTAHSDSHPAFSPDGRLLAFSRTLAADVSHLFVVPLTEDYFPSGPMRQLTTQVADNRHPVWTPDGQEILYVSTFGGRSPLYKLGVHRSEEPTLLAAAGMECAYPALSHDSRLVFSRVRSDTDFYRVSLNRAPETGGDSSYAIERWISSTLPERFARYSPDGSRIAFVSQRSGTEEIWLADSDGQNPRQLTSFAGPTIGFPSWAPDGRRLACHIRGEQTDVYIVDAENGAVSQLTNHPSLDGRASWSRDGRSVYFRSYRTGREEIWKQGLGGGQAEQVTRTGGSFPIEGPDGQTVFYTRLEKKGWEIWKTSVDRSQPQRVVGPIASGSSFVVFDQGIYFLTPANGIRARSLCFLEFETNGVKVLLRGFDGLLETVSPDHSWVVCSRREPPESDLMVWESPF